MKLIFTLFFTFILLTGFPQKSDEQLAYDLGSKAIHSMDKGDTFEARVYLEEAEKLGAENPALEVSTAQRKVHQLINADEHKQLHALFQKNGWDYDKQNVQFAENEVSAHQNTHESENVQTVEQDFSHGESQ